MDEKKCDHEKGEQVIMFDFGNRYQNNRRCYEVYVCFDCGRLINGAVSPEPMTGLQIMQMFVDLRQNTLDCADEIQAQAKELYETLAGLVDRMPKPEA